VANATREFDSERNIKELHQALLRTQSVAEFLHEMAILAARLVGVGLSCGMIVRPDGKPATVACSDPLAARVGEMQYELDDGPCAIAGDKAGCARGADRAIALIARFPGVIDQALGIIMAREHCTQDRAFAILRCASQNGNVKLRDIASAVVTSVTGEPPRPAPPFEEGRSG